MTKESSRINRHSRRGFLAVSHSPQWPCWAASAHVLAKKLVKSQVRSLSLLPLVISAMP